MAQVVSVRSLVLILLFLLFSIWMCLVQANENQNTSELRVSVAKAAMETGIIQALAKNFEQNNPGIRIRFDVLGAIAVFDDARKGLADMTITHHQPEEERFVTQGYGLHRTQIMYSEYALFGPSTEIMEIAGKKDIVEVLRYIAGNEDSFLEPSPRGGTYRKIRELWVAAGVNPDWLGYENTGTSALNALRQAADLEAYTMAEIGTYIRHREELGSRISLLYRDGLTLRNSYSIVIVNGDKVKGVNQDVAEAWMQYIVSPEGQTFIQNFIMQAYGATVLIPAAHLDQGLLQRRAAIVLKQKTRNIQLLAGLSAGLCLLLVVTIFLFFRIRRADKIRIEMERHALADSQARELAEKASAEKSQFLTNMSHEMRTPLTAILGYAELLAEEGVVVSDREQSAKVIVDNGEHLLKIIDNILDLSKIDAEKIEIVKKDFLLKDVFSDIEVLVKPQAQEKGLTFDVVCDEALPDVVYNDPMRLKQILLNLCSNALKFTDTGGITINAHALSGEKLVTFTVVDSGIGISEEHFAHIFDTFTQVDISDTRKYGGTGLGLSLSKKIAKKLGGDISVSSQLGFGSQFFLTIAMGKN